jgi:hypothetical protein
MKHLSRAARRFLEPPRFAVVAATGPAGQPQQAVTWYRVGADGLVVNGRSDRQWVSSAVRTRELSVTVADGYDYVIVRGHCVVDDDETGALEEIRCLARRYSQDEAAFDGQKRVTILVEPNVVLVHGRPAIDLGD